MNKSWEEVQSEFETALNNMVNWSEDGEAPNRMVGEYVVFTSASYMADESMSTVTNYNWFCMPGITHGHLLGLIEMGTRTVDRDLEDYSD